MLKLSKRTGRTNFPVKSIAAKMVDEVYAHSAWKEESSLIEIQTLLSGHAPYTIVLSSGMDKHHFFLSYVDSTCVVKHKNIRILRVQGSWIFKNGSGYVSNDINELIPHCLKCSAVRCKPLA